MTHDEGRGSRSAAPRVLWFYGADAVGKSVVGWEAYSQLVDRGTAAAYVDTDYLGFCHPRPDDPAELVAGNLAAVWAGFREAGADVLVVSGILVTPLHRNLFEAALKGSHFTACLLTARPVTIAERVVRRRQVEAEHQGVTLSDEVIKDLRAYGERSAQFAALLSSGGFADFTLSSDDITPAELAAQSTGRAKI